eukprot:10306282-Alexandrium_andersonii.AAC.1
MSSGLPFRRPHDRSSQKGSHPPSPLHCRFVRSRSCAKRGESGDRHCKSGAPALADSRPRRGWLGPLGVLGPRPPQAGR